MGDYSRDPNDRLQDSIGSHYVGVRLQQGVPILDTDWNELEDLRRHELATLFSGYIGDGVPGENNGFEIRAMENGGVGTIVLEAAAAPGDTVSTIEIDSDASTAAAALGMPRGRFWGAPGRLAGQKAGPFRLNDGWTLTVIVDGRDRETFTVSAGDYPDFPNVTTDQIVAQLNDAFATGRVSAAAGTGNDFNITGGDGTVMGAGRVLVGGKEVLNELDMPYSAQPLFQNQELADRWGVPIVPPLRTAVGAGRTDLVFIDVWEREVDASEDASSILPQLGIEATLRVRREWAVRVAEGVADLTGDPPNGHRYLPLARLERLVADGAAIPTGRVIDLRKRCLTLADITISPILVRDEFGLDHVNSGLFAEMLQTTSRVYKDLLESDYFIGDNLSDITTVESVMLLRVFQDVRLLAETVVADASLERLNNDAALDVMLRLYEVQRIFADTLLTLPDNGIAKRLETLGLLAELGEWLENGDGMEVPGLRPSVMSDESPDLGNAYDAQIFINSELGRRAGVLPRGLLNIQYVSGPSVAIDPNSVHQLTYSIESMLNMSDSIALALADTEEAFNFEFRNLEEDPSHPGDASHAVLTLDQNETVFVNLDLIVPPTASVGTRSRIILRAMSRVNPEEVNFANLEITVEVGEPIVEPSPDIELVLESPPINLATDVVEIGLASEGADQTFTVRATNNGSTDAEFQFAVDFIGHPDSYEVMTTLNPGVIPAGHDVSVGIRIQATASATSDEGESTMVIRLSRTADGAFQEIPIRVIPNVAP